jgi:hypothetical protein
VKCRSATADLADGEKGFVLGRAGRKRGWKFANAKQRHLRKLSGAESFELFLLLRIFEVPMECLHFRNVVRHPVEHGEFGQINIFCGRSGHVGCGAILSFSAVARRIISTTLGMPMSP